MNHAERLFHARVLSHAQEISEATPGFVIQAYEKGRLKIDVRFGEHYSYYDLASLTKIIFSATALLAEFSAKRLAPTDKVQSHWPEFRHSDLNLAQVMTHTAGLPWWRPFYRSYKSSRQPEKRWSELAKKLASIPQAKSKRAVYSDPDVLVLGQVLTHERELSLQRIWGKLVGYGIMGDMHFNTGNTRRRPKAAYAPTEYCVWRKRILQGEVHDENAWALGGIAPHAGLFGRVEDVAEFALSLRKLHLGVRKTPLSSDWLHHFTKRQTPVSVGDWGWLYMKPTSGKASCGSHFSRSSFGHTGFTGTSLWMDPRKDRQVILLSNRVHPTRKNARFVAWRPKLHDWICESLDSQARI